MIYTAIQPNITTAQCIAEVLLIISLSVLFIAIKGIRWTLILGFLKQTSNKIILVTSYDYNNHTKLSKLRVYYQTVTADPIRSLWTTSKKLQYKVIEKHQIIEVRPLANLWHRVLRGRLSFIAHNAHTGACFPRADDHYIIFRYIMHIKV